MAQRSARVLTRETAGEREADPRQYRRALVSSAIGNMVEYYDFLLYGAFSALVFGKVFFPSVSPAVGTLASFATFGVGFVARPVGGLLFGNLGDRIGRRPILMITLGGMGVATFLVGCIPGYSTIGIWAPILLVILRFIQGVAVGGEWGGAVLMTIESVPSNRRNFYAAWPQVGGNYGQVLATGAFALVAAFASDETLVAWAWRIPFWASVILIAIGLYVRLRLDESAVFRSVRDDDRTLKRPLLTVLQSDWRQVLTVAFLRLGEQVSFFLLTVFMLSYGPSHSDVTKEMLATCVIVGMMLTLITEPLFGWISDSIGRRPTYLFGAILTALLVFPAFVVVHTGSFWATLAIYIAVINIAHSAMNAVQPCFFPERFGARVRMSGTSAGAQLGAILGGGFTPLIAAMLLRPHDDWTMVAWYGVLLSVITIGAAIRSPETRGRDLNSDVSLGARAAT